MQFARKFGVVIILIAMLLFIVSQFGSCNGGEEERNKPRPSVNKEYEPAFRHEGDLRIIDEATGDTLAELPMETAKTQEEIQYGMMFRKSFSPGFYGMLFFMPEERMQSFWMRNTYVPLDIVYIGKDQKIVSIAHNAKPLDDTSLPSEGPALYVLEVPAGFCMSRGIESGDQVMWTENDPS